MDEVFHVPQAKHFCAGRFHVWDPKITTFPGIYLLASFVASVSSFAASAAQAAALAVARAGGLATLAALVGSDAAPTTVGGGDHSGDGGDGDDGDALSFRGDGGACSVSMLRCVNLALGAGCAALLFRLVRRWEPDPAVACARAVAYASYPAHAFFALLFCEAACQIA